MALDGGWLYILQKVQKDRFLVCSATELSLLKQILVKQDEIKPTYRLIIRNKEIKRFYLVDSK